MNTLLDSYNALLSGWAILLTAVFGEHWILFAGLLFFNVVDWLTGWYKARKLKKESSIIGLQGLVKKMLYWLLIAVAFMTANVLTEIGEGFIGVDLSFLSLLGWFCLASLMVNEIRSILENFVEMGYYVPAFLTNGLQVASELIDAKGDVVDSQR